MMENKLSESFDKDLETANNIEDLSERLGFLTQRKREVIQYNFTLSDRKARIHNWQRDHSIAIIDNEAEEVKKYEAEINYVKELINIRSMQSKTQNTNIEPQLKLKWNGPSKVLYDIFAQCLTKYKDGKPYIENTAEHIAEFIIQNFEGMEANKKTISTAIGKLKTGEIKPPKEQTRLNLGG